MGLPTRVGLFAPAAALHSAASAAIPQAELRLFFHKKCRSDGTLIYLCPDGLQKYRPAGADIINGLTHLDAGKSIPRFCHYRYRDLNDTIKNRPLRSISQRPILFLSLYKIEIDILVLKGF